MQLLQGLDARLLTKSLLSNCLSLDKRVKFILILIIVVIQDSVNWTFSLFVLIHVNWSQDYVFGAVWGVVIWGEWPATSAWIGMVLILFGGIYTLFRENIRNVDVATSVPMPAAAAAQQNFDEETESPDTKL